MKKDGENRGDQSEEFKYAKQIKREKRRSFWKGVVGGASSTVMMAGLAVHLVGREPDLHIDIDAFTQELPSQSDQEVNSEPVCEVLVNSDQSIDTYIPLATLNNEKSTKLMSELPEVNKKFPNSRIIFHCHNKNDDMEPPQEENADVTTRLKL